MDDLERFSSRLEQITPLVGAALEADGVTRTPDLETPTLWLADVGHAVAATLGSLSPRPPKPCSAWSRTCCAPVPNPAGRQ